MSSLRIFSPVVLLMYASGACLWFPLQIFNSGSFTAFRTDVSGLLSTAILHFWCRRSLLYIACWVCIRVVRSRRWVVSVWPALLRCGIHGCYGLVLYESQHISGDVVDCFDLGQDYLRMMG